MKNKFKLFDKLVFWEMLNQIKITGFIATAIYFVIGIITSFGLWVSVIGEGFDDRGSFPGEFFYLLLGLVFVFVPIMVKSVFTYQNRRNASDFYHALPTKRETMYFSSLVAILTWVVGIMLVSVILPVLTVAVLPQYTMDFEGMFKTLGNIFAMSVLVMGGFALGINLTGNNFTNFVVSVMILIVPRIIISSIFGMVEGFMPFMETNAGIAIINNSYNLLFGWVIGLFSNIPGQLHYMAPWGYTVVLGIVYIILGALAHKHRKSEMAAQASAYRLVQPVTRMIPAYLFGLIGIYFLLELVFRFGWDEYEYEQEIAMYWGMFSMFILSLLAYVIYELITTRRWRKVAQSFKQLPIFVGVIIGTTLIIWGCTTAALNKDVDADKMKYVEIGELKVYSWSKGKGEVRITDERLFEIIEDAYEDQVEEYKSTGYYWGENELVVGINQGGITFYRKIDFNDEEMAYLKKLYINEANTKNEKLELPRYDVARIYIYLKGFESFQYDEKVLYELLREDLSKLPYAEISESKEGVIGYIDVEKYDDDYFSVNIPISKKTPKTLDYILSKLEKTDDGKLDEVVEELNNLLDIGFDYSDGITIYSLIAVDDEGVLSTSDGMATVLEHEKFEEFAELLNRYQEEEGDTLVYIEAWIHYYDEYGYNDVGVNVGKRVSKELAMELCELINE